MLPRHLNWDDPRTFLALARAGSLAQAAKRLKIEQSTVSRCLAHLEQQRQDQDGAEGQGAIVGDHHRLGGRGRGRHRPECQQRHPGARGMTTHGATSCR
ncbi:LysR family transcriptional regulator [Pseudomonas sp. 102515]|uniref:helix-turn-helix domain-containing protein n=1 Tax=Pseudomonas sp. 102515 TaxID=3071568 RepID=UPI0035BBA6C7